MNEYLFVPIVFFVAFPLLFLLASTVNGLPKKVLMAITFFLVILGYLSLIGLFVVSKAIETDPISSLYSIPIVFFLSGLFWIYGIDKAGEGAIAAAYFTLYSYLLGLVSLIGLFLFL